MEGPGGQSARGLAVGPESGRAVLPGPANTALAMRPSAGFGLAPPSPLVLPFCLASLGWLLSLSLGRWEAGEHPQASDSRWPRCPAVRVLMVRTGSTPRHSQSHGQTRPGRAAWAGCPSLVWAQEGAAFHFGSGGLIGICRGGTGQTPEVSCLGECHLLPRCEPSAVI